MRTYNEILKEIETTKDIKVFCSCTAELEKMQRYLTVSQLNYAKEHIEKHKKRLQKPIDDGMKVVYSLLGIKKIDNKMRIKERIKAAIFALFKQEILKCYEPTFEPIQAITHQRELEFKEVKAEFRVQNEDFEGMYFDYEDSLERCKRAMFEEVQKYIKVDPKSVIECTTNQQRKIRLSLFVGIKPEE